MEEWKDGRVEERTIKLRTRLRSPLLTWRAAVSRSHADRWKLCLWEEVCWDHLQAQRLTPISATLRSAALTNALRCRRTVSVCVFKRPKRGRFAYFALKLALLRLTPALRDGGPLLFLSTGAEAPCVFSAKKLGPPRNER